MRETSSLLLSLPINVPDSAKRVDVGAISQTCVTILDDDG